VLEIELQGPRALVQLHADTRKRAASDMPDVHRMALRLLGLTADVRGFEAFSRREPVLAPLVAKRRGLHLPLTATTFEGLAWAIIGQQINLAFAFGLRRDMLELAGERIGDLIAHPTAERLAALDVGTLRRRRFSRAKAEYLIDTAAAVAAGALDPEALGEGSAVAAERTLTQLRGIGTWTARYVLMRGVGFADAAPVGDVALAAALEHALGAERRPMTVEVDGLMHRFSPYRSLATFHLWASLKDRGKDRGKGR
jgi:AraC family transcriptional regulator of adaptative response / DNA-3-methyladenine glycosylase II